jgi:ABC-type multidrug transport system ATPase subunit
MSEPPEVVLNTEGLTAGYGGPPIIEDISLTVRAGKITAIVGPNGAGKSTLLKALCGLLKSSRGNTYIRGEKTTNVPPEKLVKRGLGYVPQVSNVFPDLTVRENMEMGAYTRRRGVDARIDEICELFPDLGKSLRRRAAMLSGGQRSMLAMARHPPPCALGLHPRARAQQARRSRTGTASRRNRRGSLRRPHELTMASTRAWTPVATADGQRWTARTE